MCSFAQQATLHKSLRTGGVTDNEEAESLAETLLGIMDEVGEFLELSLMIEGPAAKTHGMGVVRFQSFCVVRSSGKGMEVFQDRQSELIGVKANGNLTWAGTGTSIAQTDQD